MTAASGTLILQWQLPLELYWEFPMAAVSETGSAGKAGAQVLVHGGPRADLTSAGSL